MKLRNGIACLFGLTLLASACGNDTAGGVAPTVDMNTNNNTMVDMGTDEPTPCDTSAECEAPEVCVYDLDTGEGFCDEAAGSGTTGDACTMATDCQSGLCINGLCADPCQGDEDCPDGYACDPADVDLNDGSTTTINVCQPDVEPCLANADCTDPDVCVIDRSGSDIALECDAPAGPGDLGDACTADADCASNLCLDGLCTAPCQTANDCADDGSFLCQIESVSTGGGAADVSLCVPRPPDACISDADCSAPDRCVANKTATDLTFECGAPNAGGGESGDACTSDTDCAQNLCVDGLCAGPCADTEDCGGSPNVCSTVSVDLGGGASGSGQICQPPTACTSAVDCNMSRSDVCYVRQETDTVDLICRMENVGGGELGELCDTNRECANNLCLGTRFRDVCVVPCANDNDCGATGYECGTATVDVPNGGTVDIATCVPSAFDPCSDNSDCATGFDCAVIEDAAGTGLESACVPSTGGDPTGTGCTDDTDCASLVCTGGFCADPCTDVAQCGPDQLCRTTTVSKSGLSGDFDLCETLPVQQCTSTDDCTDDVRVCSDVRDNMGTDVAFCEFPNEGQGPLGSDCTSSAQCREDLCLLGISDECSVVCDKDSDCAATQACTTYGDLNFCNLACTDNDDCGADRECSIQGDVLTNDVDQVCVTQIGANDLGATCTTGADCIAGLCLNTYSFTGTACTVDGDCNTGETCECPLDQPNCQAQPSDDGIECATLEMRCTNICDDDTDCAGGIPNNPMTQCSSGTVVDLPAGGQKNISTCSRP